MATGTRKSSRAAAAAATAALTNGSGSAAAAVAAAPAVSKKTKATTAATATAVTPTKRKGGKKAASATPVSKKKRTGLSTAVGRTDTTSHGLEVGVVDPECNVKGSIVNDDEDNHPYDAMLALVDPAKNMDKYFILQLIEKDDADDTPYVVYTRWGRTGSKGQALEQEFETLDDAKLCFLDKFRQKTALEWSDRENEPTVGNKYRFVTQDFDQKQQAYSGAKWQYWVDDKVNGKADGWYDYDDEAARQVERLFHEHAGNPHLVERTVESGSFEYKVDMSTLTQTNISTKTARRIRRVPTAGSASAAPVVTQDEEMQEEEDDGKPASTPAVSTPKKSSRKAAATTAASVITPTKAAGAATAATAAPSTTAPKASSRKKAPPGSAIVSPNPKAPPAAAAAAAAATAAPAVAKKSGSHPVDIDISVVGKNSSQYQVVQVNGSDDAWYDVVLNQCNIGNNNNKYYRLQMLKDSSSYYVWFKWGRVGEAARAASSTWSGPFATEAAAKSTFAKKYKDKTGNAFGTANFVEKTGKYTPIEVDNDVEINDESLLAVKGPEVEIEYEESVLDAKTKDLIEVLFSKEMRSEALTSFNLDLKKLPLCVPSKSQIEHGISFLRRIEDKLNGVAAPRGEDMSYMELSNRFYTAIPHSFGRRAAPVINDKDSLQSRYDMCNILLDMFETTETVKRIELESKKNVTKKTLPNQVDQFYESLSADLMLVDDNSDEDRTIRQYFEATKGKYAANARLLNIWSVNRHDESKRFAKYDKLDNRRLLWHGTNIAVVAPILTTGLRIMPHSGGRVGAGIYLANLQQKSAQYTSGYGSKFACMFLCEAPLGKSHFVDRDGPHASGLRAPPKGFDSVQAVGLEQPSSATTLRIEEHDVIVPDAPAVASGKQSSFAHDEFLVYSEAQVRLRYVVTVKL